MLDVSLAGAMAFFLHVSPDMTAGDLVVGAGTLALAAFTAWLARRTSREVKVGEEQLILSRKALESQETSRRRARQEDAAIAFDVEVQNWERVTPTGVSQRGPAGRRIGEVLQNLRQHWGVARALLQRETPIDLAVRSLDVVLFTAEQDCGTNRADELNFWPLAVALDDLRRAIEAFVHDEATPVPRLPPVETLAALAYPADNSLGLEGIRLYLVDQESAGGP